MYYPLTKKVKKGRNEGEKSPPLGILLSFCNLKIIVTDC
jgi:hypothetical protein